MLWIISPLSSCDSQNTNNLQKWNKEKIINVLSEEKEERKEVKEKTTKFPEKPEEKTTKNLSVENSDNKESYSINSNDLWDFLNKFLPEYKNETGNDIIIVTQCKNGKNALWYYKNWKLKLATYVSIWTKHRATIKGKYYLKHDQIRRRSRRYHNSAMPYSISIKWWYYLHQWWSNWEPQSHWCVRVPWLYQKWLYENIPDWTIIILDWLYKPTI